MQKVLLVEDDATIGQALESSLRLHGYDVHWSATGASARLAAPADLVLLDLGLPDVDGVVLCRELRARLPQAVLVILTARADEMDVVLGLEAGADDYLTKPVRLGELHARIKAHLRRGPAAPAGEHIVTVGALRIDTSARRVTVDGVEVSLRAREFDLLARLAEEPGTAVSRDALMADVWDAHWYGSTKTLDVHIAALRRKLSSRAPEITTLRGHGYRLEVTPSGP
jgi:DNA-binding response OmpR family regulator